MLGIRKALRSGLGSIRRKLIDYVLYRYVFSVGLQERLCREEFFYNAFKALSFNGIDGDYLEFGCHGCMTFALAYHNAVKHGHKAKLWAFDSFQGLPASKDPKDFHPMWAENAMSTALDQFHKLCSSRGIPRKAYHVVPGFYDKTLAAISETEEPTNIALAYVDCDLYSSTKDVLEYLLPRLKHGMIIAFDDYFCWSATKISGERMAMLELFSETSEWNLVPYMQFGWGGLSFVVESKGLTSHIQGSGKQGAAPDSATLRR